MRVSVRVCACESVCVFLLLANHYVPASRYVSGKHISVPAFTGCHSRFCKVHRNGNDRIAHVLLCGASDRGLHFREEEGKKTGELKWWAGRMNECTIHEK